MPRTSKPNVKEPYWHDLIVPIQSSTIGEDKSAYNRIWYEAEEGGYIYSGGVQPVCTILNVPNTIPLKGVLGEISVPYTDALEALTPNAKFIYRLYYETVHWVTASTVNQADGSTWYALLDGAANSRRVITYPVRNMCASLRTRS